MSRVASKIKKIRKSERSRTRYPAACRNNLQFLCTHRPRQYRSATPNVAASKMPHDLRLCPQSRLCPISTRATSQNWQSRSACHRDTPDHSGRSMSQGCACSLSLRPFRAGVLASLQNGCWIHPDVRGGMDRGRTLESPMSGSE